jgi:hypothetical protein
MINENENPKCWEKDTSQCHAVHLKSHMDLCMTEPGRTQ